MFEQLALQQKNEAPMGMPQFPGYEAQAMQAGMGGQQEDTGAGLSTVMELLFLAGLIGQGQGRMAKPEKQLKRMKSRIQRQRTPKEDQ